MPKTRVAVAAHELIEGLGVTRLGLSYQVELRDIGLSRSRFRLHLWTERRPDSFNGLEAAVASQPFATEFAHQQDDSVADLEEPLLQGGVLLLSE